MPKAKSHAVKLSEMPPKKDQEPVITAPDLVHDDASSRDTGISEESVEKDLNNDETEGKNEQQIEASSTSSKRTRSPFKWRFLFFLVFEFPLFFAYSLYLTASVLHHVHDEYLLPLMQLQLWTDERRESELTYYAKYCFDEEDMSTQNAQELIIQPNASSPTECMNHMLRHGVSIYQNVLSSDTADQLRDYIVSDRTNKEEQFGIIENEHRWSYNVPVNRNPIVAQAMHEIATHPTVRPALEAILGPNPAIIEFSDITSEYGAEEQYWHQDIMPMGSAHKYARSFIPSYSFFIPLQDTTAEMGATQVCPGSHMCGPEDGHCQEYGVQVSDNDEGVWKKGHGALMNQHTHHRGPGHEDPEAPDRVLLVVTLAPRPRFSKGELETRLLSFGSSYSIHWNQWGHTLDDFAQAPTAMRQPFKTLRALGLYKPERAQWGWDFITTTAARISNGEYWFQKEDLMMFLERGGFSFLPDFLQGQIDDDEDSDEGYYEFLFDTFLRIETFLISFLYATGGFYLAGLIIRLLLLLFRRKHHLSQPRATLLLSLGRLGLVFLFSLLAVRWFYHQLGQTDWAKNIKSGRSFNLGVAKDPESDVPATLPYRTDVLIDTRYESRYLGSWRHILDATHPGNKLFQEMVEQTYRGYEGLSGSLQRQLTASMVQWVGQEGGRFLTQTREADWIELTQANAQEACHKSLMKKSNAVLNQILTEVSFLQSEAQFGVLRDSTLHRRHIPALLNRLQEKLLHPRADILTADTKFDNVLTSRKQVLRAEIEAILKDGSSGGFLHDMSREDLNLVSLLRSIQTRLDTTNSWTSPRKDASMSNPMVALFKESARIITLPQLGASSSTISIRAPRHLRSAIPPRRPIEEPYQGAWIKVGDSVEAKLWGERNEWYKATVTKVNAVTATYDVVHDVGDEDTGLCRLCVRWYEPPEVGDEVDVFVRPRYYTGIVVSIDEQAESVDVDVPSLGLQNNIPFRHIRTFNYIWWVGSSCEVRGEEDERWERGVIVYEEDGVYDVEYLSGEVEEDIATERIRPFFP